MQIILDEENTKALLEWWSERFDAWDEEEGYPYPLCSNPECRQCMIWKNEWIDQLLTDIRECTYRDG